jgi:hypothetical protein
VGVSLFPANGLGGSPFFSQEKENNDNQVILGTLWLRRCLNTQKLLKGGGKSRFRTDLVRSQTHLERHYVPKMYELVWFLVFKLP